MSSDKWIACSERMPEEGQVVIVRLLFDDVQSAKVVDGVWCEAFGKTPILSSAGTPMEYDYWYPMPATGE